MSLSFLAKKSWNPSNRRNVEDVKKREEAAREEKRRMHELKKEYAEEREREAMEDLQVRAGLKKRSTMASSKLGWMYESADVAGEAAPNADAYLLGKAVDGGAMAQTAEELEAEKKREAKERKKRKLGAADPMAGIPGTGGAADRARLKAEKRARKAEKKERKLLKRKRKEEKAAAAAAALDEDLAPRKKIAGYGLDKASVTSASRRAQLDDLTAAASDEHKPPAKKAKSADAFLKRVAKTQSKPKSKEAKRAAMLAAGRARTESAAAKVQNAAAAAAAAKDDEDRARAAPGFLHGVAKDARRRDGR